MTEVSWKKDLETICRDDILPWLRHCTGCFDNHSKCSSPLSWKGHSLPTRLIDVGTEKDHNLRLINTSSELPRKDARTSPYLILSYCWGNSNSSAKTTRLNVKNREGYINANDLPRTIQDAIAVTRSVGVRYLWVDAICIIQAESDELDPDWGYESRRMTAYYSNALCCIAASSAKDSSHGFLKERVLAKFPWKIRRLPGGFYLTLPRKLRTSVPNWLLQRAWCLQESILSPRILHWTEYGLILQCRAGLVREGESEPVATFPFRYSGKGFAETRENQILHSARELALSEDWIDLIAQYSRMELTCPEDRLIAIDGVARLLSEKHDEEYFAGIFRSTCHLTLLWQGIGSGPCKNEFPTWSWASAERTSFDFADLLEPKSLIRSLGPFPAINKTSNYRNRQARQLEIEAPFINTVGCEQTENYPYDIWRFGTDSPASQHDYCEINFDDGPGRIDALFVLSRFSSARWRYRQLNHVPVVYQGIMLQRSERDGENAFTRVGYFSMDVRPRESGYLDSFVTKINLF